MSYRATSTTFLRPSSGLRVAAAAAATLLLAAGCPGDDSGSDDVGATTLPATGDSGMDSTGPGGDVPSHAADIQPIWNEHCTSECHEPGGEWPLLDLSEGTAYGALSSMATQLSDLKFVEPGDANMSYLWHKINATQAMVGGGGVDMPKPKTDGTTTTLTQDQLDTIEAWIAGGAPE